MTSLHSKIVVVGDGAVGKTALLHSYCNNAFPTEYEPTIFDNYSVAIMFGTQPLSLGLWDTAGQEDYDRLRPLSYPQTDCFLICYSLVNPISWQNAIEKWLPEVRFHCKDAKIVFVGLKSDLVDSAKTVEALHLKGKSIVNEAAVNETASRLGAPSVRCSALTQHGLKHVFDTAIRTIHVPADLPPKLGPLDRLLEAIFRRPAAPPVEGRRVRHGRPQKVVKSRLRLLAVGR